MVEVFTRAFHGSFSLSDPQVLAVPLCVAVTQRASSVPAGESHRASLKNGLPNCPVEGMGPGGLSSLGHFMEDTSRVLGVGRVGPSGENFCAGLGVTQHGFVASECPRGLG